MVQPTICKRCLSLFNVPEVVDAVNDHRLELAAASKGCSFCPGLEEHRSPFRAAECLSEGEARALA